MDVKDGGTIVGVSQGLRISAIPYLNTAPLLWEFEHGSLRSKYQLTYDVPAQCAERLRSGEVDVGIVPVAALVTIPGLVIVSDCAIAAHGPVRSILLVSKVPMEKIKTVAADSSSRSSVALCRVIFRKFFNGGREFTSMSADLPAMLKEADAALIIGDQALQVEIAPGFYVYDLSEEWTRLTGKGFVFALWAARENAATEKQLQELARDLQASRGSGLKHLREIADAYSKRLDLPADELERYLRENIQYTLNDLALEGLNLFLFYAQQTGLILEPHALRFAGSAGRRMRRPAVPS